MASERPVLVVGAGPVGLTAAAFLAHFGTPVRIIDSNSAPTNLSKALVLWRRSIATLDPLIPHEHWLAVGAPVQGAYFGDEGASVAHVDVSNPTNISEDVQKRDGKVHVLPAGYMVSQADVEAALVGVLQHNFNITVQRSTSLASFKVSDDAECVNCTLVSGDSEQQEQIEASYLVACDGARSAVRKQLGLSFQGATLDQRWLLADAKFVVQDGINPKQPQQEVERVPLRDALFLCTSSVGIVGTIPVAGREGVVRILWNCDSLGPAEPTLDHFQQLLMDHTRLQIKLTDAIWISEFRINERQVESYVHAGGRVLLAGDAAHVHSPAGGQGMNTGIQDAANLAWKLAMVIAGEAAAGQQLLDTYQEERWPVGASVIRRTGMLLRTNALRNYWVRMVRLLALRVVTAVPAIRQRMVSALAEDDVAYPHSSLNVLDQTFSSATTTSHSSVSTSVPYKEASAAAKAVWGSCKPGYAFPDVSVKIEGSARSAGDLLRGMPGCFGTLVVLAAREDTTGGSSSQSKMQDSAQHNWPTHWGHWQLNRADTHEQQGAQVQKVPGAVDSWGLLRAATAIPGTVGVLVRPDGMVAVVGSPEVVSSWLRRHVKVAMSAAG